METDKGVQYVQQNEFAIAIRITRINNPIQGLTLNPKSKVSQKQKPIFQGSFQVHL